MKSLKIIILFCCFFLITTPFVLAQENASWQNLGLYGGQINTVAIDPELSSVIYAGSWDGDGFFKSTDSGATWHISANEDWWFRNMEVYDISIDPHNPATIWVANNHFVDASYDYGATWKTFFFANDENRFCYSVKVDPHDPSGNTVYAGTSGPDGTDELGVIFKTTDGGDTWVKKENNFPSGYQPFNIWDIDINPNHPGEIWATSRKAGISPEGRIFMSPDGGEHWWSWNAAVWNDGKVYFLSYLDEILVHPVDPLLIFAADGYGVLKKTDGTRTDTGWHWVTDKGSCRALCIPSSNPETIYAGLVDSVAKSANRGDEWTYYDRPGEFLSLAADPSDADLLFGGDLNRGIFKSTDGAQTWVSANQGIRANQIFDSDISHNTAESILTGTVSGVYLLSAGGAEWSLLNRSMANSVLFHPVKQDTLYAGFFWDIGKSADRGATWTYRDVSDKSDAHLVSSIAISEQKPESVFAGISFNAGDEGYIVKITDSSGDFSTAPVEVIFKSSAPVNTLAINPANSQMLFGGTGHFYVPIAYGGIYKSTDGGGTWHRALPKNLIVNSIALTAADQKLVYIGCGGSDNSYSGLYKSTDGGITWKEMTKGLPRAEDGKPAFAVTDIKIDTLNSTIIYASLFRHGIYVSMDGGEYWTQIGLSNYTTYNINVRQPLSITAQIADRAASSQSEFLPSLNIIAGTSSGMYEYSTAGTGVLTGMITSETTSAPIDLATIAASSGSSCLSSEGYYLLLMPAGVYTIEIDAPGYQHATLPSITVPAGQSVSHDISLTPRSDNGSCLATSLLQRTAQQQNLTVLRMFRDTVLKKSSKGTGLISLYYSEGPQLLEVLQTNSQLKSRCLRLMETMLPLIAASLSKRSLSLPSSLLNDASSFLFDLEQVSPTDLREKICRFRRDMKQEGFLDNF